MAPARSSGSIRPSLCCPWLLPTPRKLKRSAIRPASASRRASKMVIASRISLLAGCGWHKITTGVCLALAGTCTVPSMRKEGCPRLGNMTGCSVDVDDRDMSTPFASGLLILYLVYLIAVLPVRQLCGTPERDQGSVSRPGQQIDDIPI